MRRTLARISLIAAAAAGFAAFNHAQALGLGEINVSSDLNQRFVASIPLTDISAEDLETVTVSVAPNESYDRAGIERAEYLSTLEFQIKNDGGRPRVIVTSSQIAREPVLDLLVQARWSGGKILRDYTVLLDPPAVAVTRPAPAAPVRAAPPVAAPAPRTAPVIAQPATPPKTPIAAGDEFYEPAPAKPARAPAANAAPAKDGFYNDPAFDSATGTYGPVVALETLWSIAGKVRPSPRISMDQVLLALAEANPTTILRGTTVSKGAILRVPSAERMQAVSPSAAKARLAALRGGASATARAPVRPAKPAPSREDAAALKAAEMPKPAEAPKPSEALRPELPKPQLALPPNSITAAATAPPAPAPAPAVAAAITSATAPAPATTDAAKLPSAAVAPSATSTVDSTASAPVTADAAAAAATAAAVTATSAAPAAATAPAVPATVAPAPVKSPLAQPLPPVEEPGLLERYGALLLGAALLALLALAGLAFARRRKANPPSKDFSAFKPGETASVVAPVGGAGALGKLGDTTRLSNTQILPAREAASGLSVAGAAAAQLGVLSTAVSRPAGAMDSTLILDAETAATLSNAVQQSAVTGGNQGFDKTTQVQVDTLQINVGDNDPLSEADFHLAYGLYDEAILLLMTATRQQPQRTDLKVKLAETYFAAGRPMEFQEIAEELKDELDSAEWTKLSIMGSQICPDVALFQSDGDGGLDADFDLAFNEPEFEPSTPSPSPSPMPIPPASVTAAASSNSIDFALSTPQSLQNMALPPLAAPAPMPSMPRESLLSLDDDEDDKLDFAAQPPAGLDDDASIDFMLGQSLTPLGAGIVVPDARSLPFNLGSPKLNVEIPKLDTLRGSPLADSATAQAAFNDRPTLAPTSDVLSLSLQDLEVSITPRQNSEASADDELNTKLDLARAYVEMGDNEMARSLLNEVQEQGSERHQQEAASLLQRLPA